MLRSLTEQSAPEEPKICASYVIVKNSKFKLFWDVFSNIMMMVSYFLVPFEIAFGGPRQ